jgi:DNA transformation protein and related proteins
MSISDGFVEYVVDQLSCIGEVKTRKMFGGAGIYFESIFFAIIADDTLYFKVDDTNRDEYEAAGMGPFVPFADKLMVMQYYQVPPEVLDEPDRLSAWAQKAIDVAIRKKSKKNKR